MGLHSYHDAMQERMEFEDSQDVRGASGGDSGGASGGASGGDATAATVNSEQGTVTSVINETDIHGPEVCL